MNTEIEIKHKIKSADAQRLRDLISAFKYKGKKYENSIMFDNAEETMDSTDARLRVRLISEDKDSHQKQILFTYKRRLSTDKGIKREEEIEVAFETNTDSFIKILNKMGYKKTTSYERYRETFLSDEVKITWDEFPFGIVLELEGDEKKIQLTESNLGLIDKNRYALSCDDLYSELCENTGKIPKKDILFDDPDMPRY